MSHIPSDTLMLPAALSEKVLDGAVEPLSVYLDLRALKAACDEALKAIEGTVMDEAKKYGKKTFSFGGFSWTLNDGRKTYKFDHIEDYRAKKEALKAVEERAKKAAEAMEKGLGMHTDDGEVIEPAIIEWTKPSITIKPSKDGH